MRGRYEIYCKLSQDMRVELGSTGSWISVEWIKIVLGLMESGLCI